MPFSRCITCGGCIRRRLALSSPMRYPRKSRSARICAIWLRGIGPLRSGAFPPERWSPQVHATLVHFVFPNSIFVYHPDYISHLGMFPNGVDETLFVNTMLIPEKPTDEKAEAHWQRSFELIDTVVFNSEDLVICEQIQRGLQSGANDALILGGLEQNLLHFHSTIETALS